MSIFGQGTFINDANATPEQIARKREAIAAMMGQYGKARTVGEGWVDLATGIANAFGSARLDKQEAAGRQSATDALKTETDKMDAWRSGWNPFGGSAPDARNSAMAATGGPTQQAGDAMQIRQGLIDRGLPEHIADGFMMNFQDESGLNPGINEAKPLVPGSRGGFGLAQWTGPRRRALEQFAAQRGAPVADVNTQLDFLMTELQGPEADAAAKIMAAGDAGSAGAAIVNEFLRPAAEHRAARAAEYTGGTVSTQGGMPSMPSYTGPSVQDLAQLSANPWLTPEQRSAVNVMMQQAQQASDPLRQLQLQEAQLRLEQARNPVTSRLLSAEEATSMGLPAGGAYQIGRDGKVSTVVTPSKSGAGANEFGLTPQYITDPNGNLKMIQLGKDGSYNEVKLPEGAAVAKGVEKLDLGTAYQWYNTITGEPIGEPIAKNNEQAAADTARGAATGKAEAEAVQGAPAAIAKSESGIALINSIISDPNLDGITGMIQGRLPPLSQAGVDLNTKIEQLKGKSFLEAFESLKGGGQITEREGAAAQAAMARLERAQSTPAYIEALVELRTIMETALSRAQGNTSGGAAGGVRDQINNIPDFGGMSDEELDRWIEQNG